MARPTSRAVAGYYPTPAHLVPRIASLLDSAEGRISIVDPCAGEGSAVLALLQNLTDKPGDSELFACEMESGRAETLKGNAQKIAWSLTNKILEGDAFCIEIEAGEGASVLYLNPPYDTDPVHGRLEQRWLERFTRVVAEDGVLFFVVPYYALKASAELFGKEYDNVRCFKFPGTDFETFKQVVVMARKRSTLIDANPVVVQAVLSWSASVDGVPELPEMGERSFGKVLARDRWASSITTWKIKPIDVEGLLNKVRPWKQTTRGGALVDTQGIIPWAPIQELLLRTYPVATPPRPAHIAAGIASGLFNGSRIEPAPGRNLPPLLVKGVFDREYRTIEEKQNKHGEVYQIVQVQQPKLVTTVLDLNTHKYHVLNTSSKESNTVDVSEMGVADLLKHYGGSLMEVMERQCPITYDPRKDAGTVTIASSPRKMFSAQAHAVRALVTLLGGEGANVDRSYRGAILLGEIGSGKCLGIGTPVLRFDGTIVPVEAIQKGDLLMGPDSTPRKVLGTTKGASPLYKITPTVGDPWVCNDAHILTLVHTMSDDVFDIPVEEYFGSKRLHRKLSKGNRTTHPTTEFKQFFPEAGIDFPTTESPLLDPYLLGIWYGDGTKGVGVNNLLTGISITTKDAEILQLIESTATEFGLYPNKLGVREDECPRYHLSRGRTGGKSNPLLDIFREIYQDGARLPSRYLRGSKETRKSFLAGLLDSDGSLSNGCFDFIQKRKEWSEDVCFLARSLGIRATLSSETKSAYRGEIGDTYWRICLSGDFSCLPTRLPRKQAEQRAKIRRNKISDITSGYRRARHVNRTGIKVDPIGVGEYAGFELDGDGRFLLGDFTVTHNTTVALMTAKTCHSKRMLVMCPPHLLTSWTNEVATVMPEAAVHIVTSVTDLETIQADKSDRPIVAVLSREYAKLSHGWEGVEKLCPKCGQTVPKGDLAKKRERCSYQDVTPGDNLARLTVNLAIKLSPHCPDFATLGNILRGRASAARFKHYSKNPLPYKGLDSKYFEATFTELIKLAQGGNEKAEKALTLALLAVGDEELTARTAERYITTKPPTSSYRDFGKELLYMLTPHSEDQKRISKAGRDAEEKSGAYYNSWNYFSTSVDNLVKPTYTNRLAGLDISWESGALVINGCAPGSLEAAKQALNAIGSVASFRIHKECGEFLFQASDSPRRVALARHIMRYFPKMFDFLVLDEGHEYSTDGSAQERAAHRLTSLGIPTICMTGSIMNGYAESLFTNMWAISTDFRNEFERDDAPRFIDRYGYRKRVLEDKEKDTGDVVEFGSMSDRVTRNERVVGNAPGVLPLFILKHLLPISVTLHKADLAIDLPPCRMIKQMVTAEPELMSRAKRLQSALVAQIRKDLFKPDRAGKLFGQLAELPSYLDRATADTGNCDSGNFEIRYPESMDNELVAVQEPFPASTILAKEQWMLDTIVKELDEGRNVMVFSWHVTLLPRLAKLIEAKIGSKVPILYATKVATAKRQDWIDREVVKKMRRVMVTNPICVQTGLNNLVHFATEIWMENPAVNPISYRQAVGRIDRIGQKLETRVYFPIYAETLQENLYDLLMQKVSVSTATDGLDPESAMLAAGVGESEAMAGLSIGRQIWKLLTEGERDAA